MREWRGAKSKESGPISESVMALNCKLRLLRDVKLEIEDVMNF